MVLKCLFLVKNSEVQEQIASSILKAKSSEIDSDITLKTKGTPLTIRMKPKAKVKSKLITHDDIDAIAMKTNSNVTKSKYIAQALRKINGKNNVQPNFDASKEKKRKETANYFEVKNLEMVAKKGKATVTVERVCLVAKSAQEYLENIRNFRNIPLKDCHRKIGLDKGQESLKMTASVLNKQTNVSTTKSRLFRKDFKYTGVKQIQILGLAENINENHCNVETLGKN